MHVKLVDRVESSASVIESPDPGIYERAYERAITAVTDINFNLSIIGVLVDWHLSIPAVTNSFW